MQNRNTAPAVDDPDPGEDLNTASLDVYTLIPAIDRPSGYTAVFPDGSYGHWLPAAVLAPGRGRHRASGPAL